MNAQAAEQICSQALGFIRVSSVCRNLACYRNQLVLVKERETCIKQEKKRGHYANYYHGYCRHHTY